MCRPEDRYRLIGSVKPLVGATGSNLGPGSDGLAHVVGRGTCFLDIKFASLGEGIWCPLARRGPVAPAHPPTGVNQFLLSSRAS